MEHENGVEFEESEVAILVGCPLPCSGRVPSPASPVSSIFLGRGRGIAFELTAKYDSSVLLDDMLTQDIEFNVVVEG